MKKIKEIAKIVLDDSEYNILNNALDNNQLSSARLLIDSILEAKAFECNSIDDSFEKDLLLTEIKNLDSILDNILNLYEEEYEREQIKHITR